MATVNDIYLEILGRAPDAGGAAAWAAAFGAEVDATERAQFIAAAQAEISAVQAAQAAAAQAAAAQAAAAQASQGSAYTPQAIQTDTYFFTDGSNLAAKIAAAQRVAAITGQTVEQVLIASSGHTIAYWAEAERQAAAGLSPSVSSMAAFEDTGTEAERITEAAVSRPLTTSEAERLALISQIIIPAEPVAPPVVVNTGVQSDIVDGIADTIAAIQADVFIQPAITAATQIPDTVGLPGPGGRGLPLTGIPQQPLTFPHAAASTAAGSTAALGIVLAVIAKLAFF